jgi:hypothetical protein
MRKALLLLFVVVLLAVAALADLDFKEICRIKIWNEPGGTVEVSRDEGKSWETLGSVLYPTQRTNPEGFKATTYVANGKVAATAVNAIHIKTSGEADGRGWTFSILPKELAKPPYKYKSYLSPDSSIYTDLSAGEGIFGGGFAPFVGNMVLVSQKGQPVIPLPKGYIPAIGDRIYIIVDQVVKLPKEIVFENRLGGMVTIRYFGEDARVIGQVLRPFGGIGRFEGTRYASVGRIRANHAGVIDVSTSTLGKVGGFQIIPSTHASSVEGAWHLSQWMIIGPARPDDPALEGKEPFFRYFIRPSFSPDDLEEEDWERRLLERCLVEVKLKGSDKWRPMPAKEIDDYYRTGSLPGWAGSALENVEKVRILFPVAE